MAGRRLAKAEKLTGKAALYTDLYAWLVSLTKALTALVLLFALVGRVVGVAGDSMLPTLHDRDLLLLQVAGYRPRQGDVVVLNRPFANVTAPIVKRVVATGGQRVEITGGTLRVDGVLLEEDYLPEPMRAQEAIAVTVPPGHVFVMGDNRSHSNDSRNPALGAVDERYLLGRVLLVLLPPGHFQMMN